jgi:hypothetical protein
MTTDGDGVTPGTGSRIERFLRHLDKWKSLYEVGGVVFALLISSGALQISNNANRFAGAALEIQKTEFRVRTRPYIVLGLHSTEFTGPATATEGSVHNHILTVKLRNPSDIPALDVSFSANLVVDGKAGPTNVVPPKNLSPHGSVAIFRDDEPRYPIAVPDEIYAFLDGSSHTLSVAIKVTYFGVLPEPLPYTTNILLDYDPAGKNFIVEQLEPL